MSHKEQIQFKVLNNNIVELDYPCYNCVESYNLRSYYGPFEPRQVGKFKPGFENDEHCDECNNSRFLLTEEGQAIMHLVRRHTYNP